MIPWTLHGDETGLLKEVRYKGEVGVTERVWGSQDKDLGIEKMCYFKNESSKNMFLGLMDNSIHYWNGESVINFFQPKDTNNVTRSGLFCSEINKNQVISVMSNVSIFQYYL
jgi:hypothetical protein